MFYFDTLCGKKILKSDILPHLQHFFTTRECPVRGNEAFFKQVLNAERIISPGQTHSANVEIVNNRDNYPETDGLILTEPGIAIYLSFADCVPLIIYDNKNNIAAISHAGWKGTAAKIGIITLEKMQKEFGTQPENTVVLIGPAISVCCYEVGEDVYKSLMNTVNDKQGLAEGRRVDLKKINARQFEEAGAKKIDICPYCTACNNDIFFSYRKENGTTLRHNALVILSDRKTDKS